MTLEQFYLWALVKRLTGITIRTQFGQIVKPLVVSLVMYTLIILLKTVLPITSIPLFFAYVLFGMLVYTPGIYIFDKGLIDEIKNLKETNNSPTAEKGQ